MARSAWASRSSRPPHRAWSEDLARSAEPVGRARADRNAPSRASDAPALGGTAPETSREAPRSEPEGPFSFRYAPRAAGSPPRSAGDAPRLAPGAPKTARKKTVSVGKDAIFVRSRPAAAGKGRDFAGKDLSGASHDFESARDPTLFARMEGAGRWDEIVNAGKALNFVRKPPEFGGKEKIFAGKEKLFGGVFCAVSVDLGGA